MSLGKRAGNRPARRIAPDDATDPTTRAELVRRVRYVGSANHKLRPGDYGFDPPQNPRPSKTPCDALRPVLKAEAEALLLRGIELGMVSAFDAGGAPKYVWSVDADGEVYEIKTKPPRETAYHGYRLGHDDRTMRALVLKEWRRRCP